jgi:predicted permease
MMDAFRRLRSLLLRLGGAFGAGRGDADIDDELQAHRELLVAEYERAGLGPDEARRRAAAEFGTVSSAANAYRDRRGLPSLEGVLRDGRTALHSLVRAPLLSLSVVLVLGLGIGLATAIASVFHTVVWGDLPVPGAAAVVRLTPSFAGELDRRVQGQVNRFSYPEFDSYRQSSRALEAVAGVAGARMSWRKDDGMALLRAAMVTGDYFRVLPIAPATGRLLTPADARERAVVISHRLWIAEWAGADVMGRTMWLDRSAYTIVGIAPASFTGHDVEVVDVWLPLEAVYAARGEQTILDQRNTSWLQVLGRLAPESSLASAAAEAAVIAVELDRSVPGRRTTIRVTHASRLEVSDGMGSRNRRPVVRVAAVAGVIIALLLLICGSNAAVLLLARGAERQREIAVRMALGAARGHLIRQLAMEVGLLALASAGLGVLVCIGGLRVLAEMVPIREALLGIRPDARVFAFAFAAASAVAVLFGLAPARQAARVDCLGVLKGEGLAFGRHVQALRLRRGLIAVQVAVSVVLLVVASLFGRSVSQAWQASPGYSTEGLYMVQPDGNWMPGEVPREAAALRRRIAEIIEGIPGVGHIAQATLAPFSGTGHSRAARASADTPEPVRFNLIDAQYFDALGVPIVAGRGFLPGELDVVIVNAPLAERFWGSEQAALGRALFIPVIGRPDLPPTAATVIGVIPTVQINDIGIPDEPTYYMPLTETAARSAFMVVRADPGVPLQRLVVERLRSSDPDASAEVASIDERLVQRTAPARLGVVIAGLIGLLALAVAAVGIHGVIAYTIAGRTREIGVHQALGARSAQVLRVVLGWTLRGVAIGALVAVLLLAVVAGAFGGPLRQLLNGVHPLDPVSFSLGLSMLIAVIGVAVFIPVRRAVGLSPLEALRRE